jgi:hypothetical protein
MRILKMSGRFILPVEELEMLIYQIDLMLNEDVSELFTTPEEK